MPSTPGDEIQPGKRVTCALFSLQLCGIHGHRVETLVPSERVVSMPKNSCRQADWCRGDMCVRREVMMYYRPDAGFLRRLPCALRRRSKEDRRSCVFWRRCLRRDRLSSTSPKELVTASTRRSPRQMLHPLHRTLRGVRRLVWCFLRAPPLADCAPTRRGRRRRPRCRRRTDEDRSQSHSRARTSITSPTWTKRSVFSTGCCRRTTYLAPRGDRETAGGVKGLSARDRITPHVCTNAAGGRRVPLAAIRVASDRLASRGRNRRPSTHPAGHFRHADDEGAVP